MKPGELVVGEDMVGELEIVWPVCTTEREPEDLGVRRWIYAELKGELATAGSTKCPLGNMRRLEMAGLALGKREVLRRDLDPTD